MNPQQLAKSFLAGIEACPELVFAGDPLLRQRATTGFGASDRAEEVFAALRGSLARYRDATGVGRGLAAPQIGIRSRAFVTYLNDEWRLYLDPSIVACGEERVLYRESCLSCGPLSFDVARPEKVLAHWATVDGKLASGWLSGFEARIFQHELDHLDGVLCADLAVPGSLNLRTEDPAKETFRPCP